MNNPVMWTDKFGMNAYNHFKTEQEAAIVWTKTYYK